MDDRLDKTDANDDSVTTPQSMVERIESHPFIAGAILATIVLAIGLSISLVLNGGSESQEVGLAEFEPIASEDTSDSQGGESGSGGEKSSEASNTAGSQSPQDAAKQPGGAPSLPVEHDPKIAYRLDGALWVSAEDGSAPTKVAQVANGSFALSGDGSHVAYVDAATKTIYVAEVASASIKEIGPAEDVRPSWSPDSTMLAYTAAGEKIEVVVVGADGTDGTAVGAGHTPSFSRDGKRVAFISQADLGQVGDVFFVDINGLNSNDAEVKASEVVWGGDGLILAVSAAEPGQERILTTDFEGHSRQLLGAHSDDKPVMYASLLVSPDGRSLLCAAHGDDGYSQALTLNMGNPEPISLAIRRDTYPQAWSSDSRRVFFVEGNAFQGEATSLMSALTDGLGRSEVVVGAGL